MQFVLPYVRPVKHVNETGNFSLAEEFEDSQIYDAGNELLMDTVPSDDVTTPTPTPSEKTTEKSLAVGTKESQRKRFKTSQVPRQADQVDMAFMDYLSRKRDDNDDHRKMFLLSLLPDVTQLSDEKFRTFKIKTMELTDALLTQQKQQQFPIHNSQNLYSTTTSPASTHYSPTISPIATPMNVISNQQNIEGNEQQGWSTYTPGNEF